jgi:hypothetical protein
MSSKTSYAILDGKIYELNRISTVCRTIISVLLCLLFYNTEMVSKTHFFYHCLKQFISLLASTPEIVRHFKHEGILGQNQKETPS